MNHISKLTSVTAVVLLACGCTGQDDGEELGTSEHALESASPPLHGGSGPPRSGSTDGAQSIPNANEMTPPASGARGALHRPSVIGPPPTPSTLGLDLCPDEKPNRPDWADLVREKANRKASLAAHAATSGTPGSPLPAPSSDHLARQARFLEIVPAENARLWAMPEDQRQQAYFELKQRYLPED